MTAISENELKKGLSSPEAARRLKEHGFNELEKKEENKDIKLLLRQVTQNPIVYILLVAALLSFFSEEAINSFAILAVIFFVILLGFVQERKAERAMEALRSMIKPESVVLRDGKATTIPAREIVPGDVLVLEAGDGVTADAKIFDSLGVRVDEAALTGESLPVSKSDGETTYAGTKIVYGKCRAIVEKTGMLTSMGNIAASISEEDEDTPLQKKVNGLVKTFALFTLSLIFLIFIIGISRPNTDMLELAVLLLALAVASVPEGLPLVITTALALGMNRMAGKNAIIRKLSAVETLGSVTVICTDKTGTITRNEMVVEKVFSGNRIFEVTGSGYEPEGHFINGGRKIPPNGHADITEMMLAAVLCNNSLIEKKEGSWRVVGDPTEGALVTMAAKYGIFKEEADLKYSKSHENFFTSEKKMMSTVHSYDGKKIAFAKGAPEIILAKCSSMLQDGQVKKLEKEDLSGIRAALEIMGKDSLRVLAIACNRSEKAISKGAVDDDLTFYGLVGMADPVREGVADAIDACLRSGINIKMITGDNPETARAVARKIKLVNNDSLVLTGADIDSMDDLAFSEAVKTTTVFARVKPEHKLRIVNALRSKGEIVAMTGDGVNDAPALKKADIGIAMGIKGTEVSKEASDMVLADDNFTTIVEAIRGGRAIFENIQKTTAFIVSRNYAEVFLLLITVAFLGVEYTPLVALQILFINLIDEEIPAVVLASDTPRKGIMNARPRDPKMGILPRKLLALMFGLSVFTALIVYALFMLSDPAGNISHARTVVFVAIISTVVFNTFSFRSLYEPLSISAIFSNRLLIYAVIGSIAAASAVVYIPFLQAVFHTVPLELEDIAFASIAGILTTIFIEANKRLFLLGPEEKIQATDSAGQTNPS